MCRPCSDPDPSVMGAALHPIMARVKRNPGECKDLATSFINILKQAIEHRLPKDYEYHRMPTPWLQVRLIAILGYLAQGDRTISDLMYDILQEVMRR